MLVLSRKEGEAIIINGNIEIKIIEISGDKIKVGIEAPHDIKILRSELCQTVESNKQAATKVEPNKLLSFINRIKKQIFYTLQIQK